MRGDKEKEMLLSQQYKNQFYSIFWSAEDGSGSLEMGDYKTLKEAVDAMPSEKRELVDQGGTIDGVWEIGKRDTDGEVLQWYDESGEEA